MRIQILCLFIGLSFITSGCSIHPLQEDVTRLPLPEIIHKVRCEAKDAVEYYDPHHRFDEVTVTYVFDFIITEGNEASADGKFTVPISHGVFSIGFEAGKDLERKSDRQIRIVDSFGYLRGRDCSNARFVESAKYPISGTTGLDEVVANFIDLAHEKPLDRLAAFIGTYRDIIAFTTTIGGAIKPSITLTPLSGRIFNVNGVIGGERKDLHQLTIQFEPPPIANRWQSKVQPVQIVYGVLEGTEVEAGRQSAYEAARLKKLLAEIDDLLEKKKVAGERVDQKLSSELGKVIDEKAPSAFLADKNAQSQLRNEIESVIAKESAAAKEVDDQLNARIQTLVKEHLEPMLAAPQVTAPPPALSSQDEQDLRNLRALRRSEEQEYFDRERDIRDFLREAP